MHINIAAALLLFSTTIAANGSVCLDWFAKSKVPRDEDCLLNCATVQVDMATFSCPNQCDELCKVNEKKKFVFSLTQLYPALTAAERALAAENSAKMLIAYKKSWQAESLCRDLYPTSGTNDESDACRHFVWAALLFKEFGRDFSEKILYAHEQEPTQPEAEKAMDLANNQRGVSMGELLIKQKLFTEKRVIEEFSRQLKEKKIVVLNKKNEAKK